jgi:hypothetical protein
MRSFSYVYVFIGLVCAVFFFWLMVGSGMGCAMPTNSMLAGPVFQCLVLPHLGALTILLAMLFALMGDAFLSRISKNLGLYFNLILSVCAFWYLVLSGLWIAGLCIFIAMLLVSWLIYIED